MQFPIFQLFSQFLQNIKFFILLFFLFSFHTNIFSETQENVFLPIDLTKLQWYGKQGFLPEYTKIDTPFLEDQFTKVDKFPILPNAIFMIPGSFYKVHEFTLLCKFSLKLDRIEQGKELAFLFSGIGESWAVYVNGEKIKDKFGLQEGKITKYRMTRNAVITLPYNLLKEENLLVIRLAGNAPASFLSKNLFLGLRFKEGYILDYEKKIRENTQQTSLLLFNAIYIFFGFYHLFFFVRWTEKKYNLFFAIFSLSISTYFLSFSVTAFDLVEDTRILIFFAYISQPLSVLFFILFLTDYFYPNQKISKFLKYVIVSNSLVVLSFLVFKVNFFLSLLYAWYALVAPQILYIFYFIVQANRKHLKDSLLMAASISMILMVVVWEMLDTVFFQTGLKLLQFAYFAFIVSMVTILANRFIEINWETGRLNTELLLQRNSFSKFVPIQFLELLDKKSAIDIAAGDCKLKEMTVLFCDIRSFTSLSETMTPEENFHFINSYLRRMNPIIQTNKGFIDKFIGDAIMAIFPLPDNALQASIGMMDELKRYNVDRAKSGYKKIKIGIGINTGPLMMGTVGNEERMSTTVIGDTVNLASRLESLTKEYYASILVSEYSVLKLSKSTEFLLREIDSVIVRGKTNSIKIYECYNHDDIKLKNIKTVTREKLSLAINFEISKNPKLALQNFMELQSIATADPVPVLHIKKCQELLDSNNLDTSHNTTVLLVDDNPAIIELSKRMLNKRGYVTFLSFSAEEAFQKIIAEKPQVIITDIHLPGMSGFDLIELIQRDVMDETYDPLIIVSSGEDIETYQDSLKQYDINLIISKPINYEVLNTMIQG